MLSIKNKSFIKINKEDKMYFGGNQSWWKDENTLMKERGCGVIAMCNLELYLDNQRKKEISYQEYKDYVENRFKKAYPMAKNKKLSKLGLLPTTMEHGLDVFYSSRNIDPIISWAPTISKKKLRGLMEKMLRNNIPIVASYYVFNKKNKLDLYTYDEENGAFEKSAGIRRHYFNIIGLTKREGKELLVISTWGGRYYAYYDQWIKKLSIFSNILYVE